MGYSDCSESVSPIGRLTLHLVVGSGFDPFEFDIYTDSDNTPLNATGYSVIIRFFNNIFDHSSNPPTPVLLEWSTDTGELVWTDILTGKLRFAVPVGTSDALMARWVHFILRYPNGNMIRVFDGPVERV